MTEREENTVSTGIVISTESYGGFAISLDGTKLGSTGSFGTEPALLMDARTFAKGAAAAIFATTGAIVSIEEKA